MSQIIKVIKIYQKQQGLLTPPKAYITALGWEKGHELFISHIDDALVITDFENFKKLDIKKIKSTRKTLLTGYKDSTKYRYFVFRIIISRDLVKEFGLENDSHVELTLDENKMILKKHEE